MRPVWTSINFSLIRGCCIDFQGTVGLNSSGAFGCSLCDRGDRPGKQEEALDKAAGSLREVARLIFYVWDFNYHQLQILSRSAWS